jgi:transposase
MPVLSPRCCGVDVHKKNVVVCVLLTDPDGMVHRSVRTFATMTADLFALDDWLRSQEVPHVAMESTGVLWRPVYHLPRRGTFPDPGQCGST